MDIHIMGNGPYWALTACGDWVSSRHVDLDFFRTAMNQVDKDTLENALENLGIETLNIEEAAAWDDLWRELGGVSSGFSRFDLFPDFTIALRRPSIWNTYKFDNMLWDCFALYILPWGLPKEPAQRLDGSVVHTLPMYQNKELTPEQQGCLNEYVTKVSKGAKSTFSLSQVSFISSNEGLC